MLKIGSAYKIKQKMFDAFFTNQDFTGVNDDLTTHKYIGQIFTVVDTFQVSKNNFYYPHHRFLILFEGKVIAFIATKNGKVNNHISNYLEEITEE